MINDLLRLEMNGGIPIFMTNEAYDGLCTCFKKQPGNLTGTTDLCLLPPIIIKNALPCFMQVMGKHEPRGEQSAGRNTAMRLSVDETQKEFTLEKSEEVHFHGFTYNPYNNTEFLLKFRADGFMWTDYVSFNFKQTDEIDLEIAD